MSIAKGAYILFLKADDFVNSDLLLQAFMNAFENDTDITLIGTQLWDQKINAQADMAMPMSQTQPVYNIQTAQKPVAVLNNAHIACLFKREFLTQHQIAFSSQLDNMADMGFKALSLMQADRISNVYLPLICHNYSKKSVINYDIFTASDAMEKQLQKAQNWSAIKDLFITYKWQAAVNYLAYRIDYSNERRFYKQLKKRLSKISASERMIIAKDRTLLSKIQQIEMLEYLQLKYFISDFTLPRIYPAQKTDALFWKLKRTALFFLFLPSLIAKAHQTAKTQMHNSSAK